MTDIITDNKWTTINDNRILHVWADSEGKEVRVHPSFYAEAGIPCCDETGDDLTYLRTEILI